MAEISGGRNLPIAFWKSRTSLKAVTSCGLTQVPPQRLRRGDYHCLVVSCDSWFYPVHPSQCVEGSGWQIAVHNNLPEFLRKLLQIIANCPTPPPPYFYLLNRLYTLPHFTNRATCNGWWSTVIVQLVGKVSDKSFLGGRSCQFKCFKPNCNCCDANIKPQLTLLEWRTILDTEDELSKVQCCVVLGIHERPKVTSGTLFWNAWPNVRAEASWGVQIKG